MGELVQDPGVEMMGLEPTTPCLQSQFGRCCHLREWGPALVEHAAGLSVVVCWGPFRTAVNGTLVARPLRTTPSNSSCLRFHPDCRVRPVLGDHRLVGKSLEGSRSPGKAGRLERWPLPGRRPGRMVEVRSGYVDRPVSAGFGWWVTFGGSTSRSRRVDLKVTRGGRWPGLNAAGLHPFLRGFGCSLIRSQISRLAGGLEPSVG